MSYSGNNISWPVSISDVQHVLGNNSSELKDLCVATNINRWARYKPERITGHLPIGHGNSTSSSRTRKKNHFSLDVPYCIEWQDRDWHQNVMNGPVADVLYGNYVPWEYLKPRGTTNQGNEFFRLSDFSCLPDDDTDPYYSAQTPNTRGYNHGAEIPFVTWLDMNAGFTTSQTTVDGISIPLYEFNIQHVSNITISFANESRGDELKLTDFIDIDDSAQETDVAWRPVVQVFTQDTIGGVSWDSRSQPDQNLSFYGNVIKTNQNQKWSIQIPLSSFDVSDIGTGNKFYHMCVGIGCVNNNGTSWKGPDISGEPAKALFLPPYRDSQVALKEYPFHYYFWVVNHNVRGMAFTKLVWFNTGTVRDIVTDGYNSSFNLTSDATGVAWITFTVTKDTSQKIHFISEHGTADTGYEPFKIKFVSGNDEYFLSPVTENSPGCGYAGHASSVDNNAKVETGAATEIATLYGKLDISLHNLGSSTTYHVWTQTGSGGTWTNNGTLEIYKH